MLNKLLAMIRRYDMLQSDDRVICAVSGGADSMALLWAMYLLKDKLKIHLEAAHFNHGLRGHESDRDEAFVRTFCEQFEIPFHSGTAQVVSGKKGLEAAARDARYGFLKSLPGKIATAHTANDNAETVLMHLVRGTGLKGLGAIAPINGSLIRPMLMVTRDDVMSFLEEYHITHIEDSSNETDVFLRNRLRHHVMPLLQHENPRLAENLSAMAMDLRADEKALSALQFGQDLPNIVVLRSLEEAQRRRLLSDFLVRCGVKEPERNHVLLAEELVFSDKPSASADFPGGVRIQRNYDRLELESKEPELYPVVLNCPGITTVPTLNLRVTCSESQSVHNKKEFFTVCAQGSLILRAKRTGDTIRLSGGTKSLKKLFIDRKIPASKRNTHPVLADDAGVIYVYGIGPNLDRIAPGMMVSIESITPGEDK